MIRFALIRGRKAAAVARAPNAPSRARAAALNPLKDKMMLKTVVPLFLSMLLASGAQASTRSFFSPTEEGHRIGACLSDGSTCGKPVADQFCQKAGFAESILFAREAVTSARQIDNGKFCEGETCQAFTRIKCYQPLEQAASAP